MLSAIPHTRVPARFGAFSKLAATLGQIGPLCFALLSQLHAPKDARPLQQIWSYAKADIKSLNATLDRADWSTTLSAPTIDEAWSAWKTTLLAAARKAIPSKKVRHTKRKPCRVDDQRLGARNKKEAISV